MIGAVTVSQQRHSCCRAFLGAIHRGDCREVRWCGECANEMTVGWCGGGYGWFLLVFTQRERGVHLYSRMELPRQGAGNGVADDPKIAENSRK